MIYKKKERFSFNKVSTITLYGFQQACPLFPDIQNEKMTTTKFHKQSNQYLTTHWKVITWDHAHM